MKAAVLYGKEDIRLEEVPDLGIIPGDKFNVLVKVKAAGICGTDIHFYNGLYADRVPKHAVLGHELCGEVVAVGDDVRHLKVGDRVAIEPLIGCGECVFCKSGDYHLCPDLKHIGKHYSGGFAEYTKAPEEKCVVIPPNVTYQQAALLDCYAVGVHALKRVPVSIGDTVVVYGGGPVGFCTAQVAKAAGAKRVILIDLIQEVLDVAKEVGIDVTINSSVEDPVAKVLELTEGKGADIVFDSVGGHAPILDMEVKMLRPQGKLGMIGVRQESTFVMSKAHFKEIDIIFIFSYSYWNYQTEFSIAMGLLETERVISKPVVTHTFPLSKVQEAFSTARDKANSHAIKVMVVDELGE